LELGGKNPVIIDETADIALTARRLVWAKCLNSGQTCVAPDHLYVHESVAEELKKEIQRYTDLHWPDMMNNKDYTRAQSLNAFKRLTSIIEADKKFKVFGGKSDESTLMVEFALFDYGKNADAFRNSALMNGEIFGPLIPMMIYTDVNPILRSIQKFDKPLSLYCFTRNRSLRERVAKYTTSGQLVFNDFNMQMANANLPFGGVGKSGQGSYHGYYSFKAFTHTKSVLYKSGFLDIPFRYPPWNGYPIKTFIMRQLVMDRPLWLINSLMKLIQTLPLIILIALVYTFKY
jgi:aldehyde dehydrogenase (NAD+)